MLLVDYHHAEVGKLYRILDDGMGAYENLHTAVLQPLQYLLSLLTFHDTCQQFHPDVHSPKEVLDGLQVLLGENLRRCHDTCLVAVVEGDEHRHQCHQRLAAAYIPL